MKMKIEVTLKDDWREGIAKVIGVRECVDATLMIDKGFRDIHLIMHYLLAPIKALTPNASTINVSRDANKVLMEWKVDAFIGFACLADYLEAIISLPTVEATTTSAQYYVNVLHPDRKEEIKYLIELLRATLEEGDTNE